MSAPRHIRRARRNDPWAPTERLGLEDRPEFRWNDELPTGDAQELPFEDGLRQYDLARALIDAKECDE